MKIEIGAYEAKTRLPELLQQVRAGKRFTITNRGKAIADLVPSRASTVRDKAGAVAKFQDFLRRHPVAKKADVQALKAEGRE